MESKSAKSTVSQNQLHNLTPNALLVYTMAVACGVAVANLYYAQPLLDTFARDFGVSAGTAGLIVTMTQLGYVVGLAFIVPLGDLLERRRLIASVSLATVAALVLAALAPTISIFLIASALIGLTAVVAQILVPMAANLAVDEQRGAVVGRVMSGLLVGILLARAVSGVVADAFGWRALFWIAAALMLVQSIILWVMLPNSEGESELGYAKLLLSALRLFAEEPLLRRRTIYGTLGFGVFSIFWTAIAFLLARSPYHYSDTVIGLFGLLGAGGAVCATFAGKIYDQGSTKTGTGFFLVSMVLSFLVMGLLQTHLSAIVVGVVLLDVGQQGTQVLNQSVIYELRPDARSRITTAYMTAFFFGGVIGSAASAFIYQFAGWPGVSMLGGAIGLINVLYWLTDKKRYYR